MWRVVHIDRRMKRREAAQLLHNGILLKSGKGAKLSSCRNMDGPRVCLYRVKRKLRKRVNIYTWWWNCEMNHRRAVSRVWKWSVLSRRFLRGGRVSEDQTDTAEYCHMRWRYKGKHGHAGAQQGRSEFSSSVRYLDAEQARGWEVQEGWDIYYINIMISIHSWKKKAKESKSNFIKSPCPTAASLHVSI